MGCCTVGSVGETWKEKRMAQTGRVMPNCLYAANPYHECTEACLHKIKETKLPPKTKKTSDYRRSVTDGELGKKMNEEKRTNSGVIPLKFGSKKKLGSKPELPVLDNIPASKIGAIYLSDATSPISNYYEKKKVKPKSNELIPVSGELHKPANHKAESENGCEHLAVPVKTKQEGDKNSSPKVVPITTSVDDTGSEAVTTKSLCGSSKHFCSSDDIDDQDSDDDNDGEETESVVSETRVPVGRYHVKESFAPILRSIFEKYKDIGASCHLESLVMRSYYIECVCFVVQELQSTTIMQLTKSKIKELLAILKDIESAQLRVAWLRTIVDEIAENIELFSEHRDVEAAKANYDLEMEKLRKELESENEILVQKEKEVSDIKTKIEDIKEHLSELEVKASDLDKNLLSIKSKVQNLDSKSLLDDLL